MTTPAPATTPPRERTGACLCGRIKYRLVGESVYDTFCHCIPCQKWTGSVALTASICPKEVCTLTMEGYYCREEASKKKRRNPTQPNHYMYPTQSLRKEMTRSLKIKQSHHSQHSHLFRPKPNLQVLHSQHPTKKTKNHRVRTLRCND
jgi:hypothetical protein